VTELGTCYSLAELRALRDFCTSEGLRIYIDGARIANAVAHLGCSLADIAACADVLSFGGTKNGAMGVEAVLVMTGGLADDAPYFRKQQMQLSSKMRFLSAQLIGLLEDDLWLRNARQANAMASRLAAGLSELPGIRLAYPMESNGVFAELSTELADALHAGWNSHVWSSGEDGRCVVRLMTAYDTTEADIDDLVAAVKARS